MPGIRKSWSMKKYLSIRGVLYAIIYKMIGYRRIRYDRTGVIGKMKKE